jgi:hypothetical protein
MRTLYNRLSQENKAKLEKMGEKYPTIFRVMKKELEETSNFLNLNVGTAIGLAQELNNTTDITVSFLSDLFENK